MIHNFKQGFIDFCQICNSKKIQKVIDLGFQPLADDLQKSNKKNSPSLSYPIKIYLCKSCRLLQNNFIVDYRESGGWGCCYHNFFEVWKKSSI